MPSLDILVVEDEPRDQKLAQLVLTAAGHTVTQVDAAFAARDEIQKKCPQVILLDLRLQGTSGLELARELKANPRTAGIAILAVTAFPALYSREDAMAAGCDGYILKPINTRTLTHQVREAFARLR